VNSAGGFIATEKHGMLFVIKFYNSSFPNVKHVDQQSNTYVFWNKPVSTQWTWLNNRFNSDRHRSAIQNLRADIQSVTTSEIPGLYAKLL